MSALRLLPRKSSLSAILVALSLGACSDSTEPFPAEATFTGHWAGRPWAGQAFTVLVEGGDAGDTLYVGGTRPINARSMPIESIRIRVLFRGAGTYQLGSGGTGRAELEEYTGGDVVHAVYATSMPNAGTLVITSSGGPGGPIEGRVSFVGVSDSPYGSYGTTAFFANGQFRATLDTYP